MRPTLVTFLLLLSAVMAGADPRSELKSATLDGAPAAHHAAIAFLIDGMPARDVTTLTPGFLRENVALAYQARNEFPWAKQIPEEIFFNDVLPYASLDESRDNWRAGFLARFRKHVASATTARDALIKINAAISQETGVKYSTKRRAPNQSPLDSMNQKIASCTGLSILLVDALRAVGLPARIAGTAMWITNNGNHSWVEVWLPDTRQWHFTEYGANADGIDHGWLLANAARAIPGDPVYGIHATSWKKSPDHFPLVWAMRDTSVPAVDVTQRYIDLGNPALPATDECELQIEALAKSPDGTMTRQPIEVEVRQDQDVKGRGTTPTTRDDMNHFLTIKVKQGQTYQVIPSKENARSNSQTINIAVGEKFKKVTLSPGL